MNITNPTPKDFPFIHPLELTQYKGTDKRCDFLHCSKMGFWVWKNTGGTHKYSCDTHIPDTHEMAKIDRKSNLASWQDKRYGDQQPTKTP